jgi:ribose 5-phosphate isomerase B
MKIAIASDHRGYNLKQEILEALTNKYDITDLGTDSTESTDYTKYAFKLGEKVASGEFDRGILICGSGIGISIAANKVKGIRCAKVSSQEEAYYTRNDNDANVISFGEKMLLDDALEIIETFIRTEFSNLEKHNRRINDITMYENGEYHER